MESNSNVRFVDLFCGIGGFRIAAEQASKRSGLNSEFVFSSDIDLHCQRAYEENFGERPSGDIEKVEAHEIPDHDLLLAGFPCQPFSIIGSRRGFEDTRGTLFFDIARIIEAKRPKGFVLENVKMLRGHDGGKTLARIMEALRDLGYFCDFRVLNALDFGLPQKRERIFIVGHQASRGFSWPEGKFPMRSLESILERNVSSDFYASKKIREQRLAKHKKTEGSTVWHENKSGNISVYPYSCALRAGASYNYLLVNGERRFTPREMLRLQGFPDSFRIICNYSQTRKQAGNSLPVPVAEEVVYRLLQSLSIGCGKEDFSESQEAHAQMVFMEPEQNYGRREESAIAKR